jgi:aldehyde dehydrogenase (NAD+)
MGSRAVVVPSERSPLVVTDFYQVLDTSDVPAGVVNIITGIHSELAPVLAAHDDVDGIWYFGANPDLTRAVEKASAGNMKRTFTFHGGRELDFFDAREGEGRDWLREATQVKNVWVPYGA